MATVTYAALLQRNTHLPSPDWRNTRPGESPEQVAVRAVGALEALLVEQHERTAASIVGPPVQAAAGMAMYHPRYLRDARALCDPHAIHLIADEIAVDYGRTGSFLACEQAGIQPDFVCLSKGITGGYLPLSVTLTTDDVYTAFYDDEMTRAFLHSHSYSGNALACRAALAVLDIRSLALDRGLLLRPLGNTVYLMPPYVIEEEQMDMLVAGICAILDVIE